jgi:PAS domain S-box-containing protein
VGVDEGIISQAAARELKQERDHLASSVRSLPLGYILTDDKAKILTMNPVMRKLLGLSTDADSFNTKPLNLEIIDRVMNQARRCLETGKYMELIDTSFKSRYLRIFLSPVVEDDRTTGVVVLVEDVTEAKILERSKDEFFSIASHELRTPLTAIRGNTSMLKQYFPKALKDPDMNDMISDIHDSSVRLIEIVNDFLDVSRLEQGKIKFTLEAFAIDKVIEKVIYELGGMSKEKSVRLRIMHNLGDLPHVYADKDRVKQVIYNLLGNAMKFTGKGSITVDANVLGERLNIRITDTGHGISAQGQKLLFRKFQQTADSPLTRDTTRGTGLGLYISKLLLERMDGSITLERSEVDTGSTFSFTLPLAEKGHTVSAA